MTSPARTYLTSHFVRHKNCPKCHSRDNLGVYSDGHEWCFGCGYYKPGEWTLERARQKQEKGGEKGVFDLSLSSSIGGEAIKWLKSYGISDEEIKYYEVQYDHKRELLCFPLKEESGRIAAYTCRNFGPDRDKRKSLTFGSLSHPVTIASPEADKNTGVFVEDIVSAIKVGRSFQAYPVLGSNIPLEALKWAVELLLGVPSYIPCLTPIPGPPRLGIWLDRDMHGKANRLLRRYELVWPGLLFHVRTEMDPKEYSTVGIKKIVEEARNFF